MDLETTAAVSVLASVSRRWLRAWHEDVTQTVSCGAPRAWARDVRLDPAAHAAAWARACAAANQALDRARALGVQVIPWGDVRYPAPLATVVDPPPVLWGVGSMAALESPAVAIVGSRSASAYALEVADRLGCELGERGVVVVSGLARGVDSAAHRGALRAGGLTVAVLGSGVDVVYPPEHRSLGQMIGRQGMLLSELPPGVPPRRQHFPARNRIISGLAEAVVIVEASERSGSLITARCGLDQGREVMAVPGNVLSGRNRGSHALLKDGAKVVEGVDDILEEIRGLQVPGGRRAGATQPEDGDPVLRALTPGEPRTLDELVLETRVESPKLLPRLLALELEGRLSRLAGGRFVRRS